MENSNSELYGKTLLFSIFLFIGIFLGQLMATLLMEYLSPGEIDNIQSNLSLIHLVFLTWFSFVFCIALYFLFVFVLEKRKIESLNIVFSYRSLLQMFVAIFAVVVLDFVYLAILKGSGFVIITFQRPENVYLIVLFAFFSAIYEELVFRGYLLQNFLRSKRKITGILVSSLLFAVLHVFNPNMNVLTLLNVFIIGIFLAMVTVRLRNIYFAVSFHAAFNFCDIFFGLNNVLNENKHGWLILDIVNKNDLLTGGLNGITGSVILSLALIIMIAFLLIVKQKHFRVANS